MKALAPFIFILVFALSALAELPVLQVRSVPLLGKDTQGIQNYEIAIVCPDNTDSTFLCIDAVSELRRWPYKDGDTYGGSPMREITKVQPKVSIRFRVDGDWKQRPETSAALNSVPHFEPLAVRKSIRLDMVWTPKGKALNEVEVNLTQQTISGEVRTVTLSWKP